MKVTELKLTYGETIKPRDYESRKCEMEVHVQLEETDDVKKVTESILTRLKERVRKQLEVVDRKSVAGTGGEDYDAD